ncbi:Uncharacterised protein [Bordetella pertussis]|nr:Uncharacterised protein [Bordetella pertussis]
MGATARVASSAPASLDEMRGKDVPIFMLPPSYSL